MISLVHLALQVLSRLFFNVLYSFGTARISSRSAFIFSIQLTAEALFTMHFLVVVSWLAIILLCSLSFRIYDNSFSYRIMGDSSNYIEDTLRFPYTLTAFLRKFRGGCCGLSILVTGLYYLLWLTLSWSSLVTIDLARVSFIVFLIDILKLESATWTFLYWLLLYEDVCVIELLLVHKSRESLLYSGAFDGVVIGVLYSAWASFTYRKSIRCLELAIATLCGANLGPFDASGLSIESFVTTTLLLV